MDGAEGPPASAGGGSAETGITDASAREASIGTVDASRKVGVTVDGGTNACGVCDREWECNGSTALWRSTARGCESQKKGKTVLKCDGTMYSAEPLMRAGTWTGNDYELQLHFTFGGTTQTYYCLPPP